MIGCRIEFSDISGIAFSYFKDQITTHTSHLDKSDGLSHQLRYQVHQLRYQSYTECHQ